MKRLLMFVVLTASASSVFSQTADEVINKFIVASGGKEKLSAINTLQYVQNMNLNTPMGDISVPLKFFKERDKLFRMQASMQLGMMNLDFFTVVTDTAGYVMLPAMPMLGSEGGIQKMEEKDRAAQAYQFDPAGMFAVLVDYSAKGNKAELLKDEPVNNEDCFKVRFTSSGGDTTNYYFSKTTNLVVKTDIKGSAAAGMAGMGSMMGGMSAGAANTEISILYADYQDINGVKFPGTSTMKNQLGDMVSKITDIKINEPIEAKWYKAE